MIFWILTIAAAFFILAILAQHTPHATDHPIRCPSCGASHPPFARFCRHCGQPLD